MAHKADEYIEVKVFRVSLEIIVQFRDFSACFEKLDEATKILKVEVSSILDIRLLRLLSME